MENERILFPSAKFLDSEYANKIQKATSPMKAAELGRTRKVKIRPNWDNIKDYVMYEALKAKFTQHKELKELITFKYC